MTDLASNPLVHETFRIPFDQIRAEHVEPAIHELLAGPEQVVAGWCELPLRLIEKYAVHADCVELSPLIAGEDRIRTSGVEATIRLGGVDVPIIVSPLAHRTETTPRGDADRPLAGVPPTSILLDRLTDYVRAMRPFVLASADAAAKAQLGTWDTQYDDDRAAWLRSRP